MSAKREQAQTDGQRVAKLWRLIRGRSHGRNPSSVQPPPAVRQVGTLARPGGPGSARGDRGYIPAMMP